MKKLPSYFTFANTEFMPPIDNQGGIGSCASQSVSHMQFTIAYARHMAELNKKIKPSTHPERCFTPRFTYNISGPGTAWVYEALIDHGCLRVGEYVFAKTETGASMAKESGTDNVLPGSAGWPTAPGQMKKALTRRLAPGCFEQVWVANKPYNSKLTTSARGRKLLKKIKEAVCAGNAVVTGGYPGRWVYTKLNSFGNLGKSGESVAVAAAGNGGGGHQVTIVGYDDNVGCEYAGAQMRGAFLIANSYGTGWQNKGYTWMMYDSVNTVSEYPELNNPEVYSLLMHLTPGEGLSMQPESLSEHNQDMLFTATGKATVNGKEYTAYSVFDKETSKYIVYSGSADGRAVTVADEAKPWVLIPYEDLFLFPSADRSLYDKAYEGSFWLYAVELDCAEDGNRFLDAGISLGSRGRNVSLATLNTCRYPVAKSWDVAVGSGECFESKLTITAGKGKNADRIWTLDQFCFTDWHNAVVTGLPKLFTEVEITTAPRECFYISLTRTDRDGRTERYTPAIFRYGNRNYHPSYIKLPKRPEAKKGKGASEPFDPYSEYLTFGGIVNGQAETGYFALSYGPLLELADGSSPEDYKWGVEVIAKDHGSVRIGKMSLRDSNDKVICTKKATDFVLSEGKAAFTF